MSLSFLPQIITEKLTDLTPDFLKSRGIQLLMLDFDNTIVPYTTNVPTEQMETWLQQMNASEIQICIVSNSKRDRVPAFCAERGLDCITHAKKPFSKGISECLTRYGVKPEHAALVGDQIYTDTLGANGTGVTSILVHAIDNHNFWLKARHVLEIPFIAMASGRKLK